MTHVMQPDVGSTHPAAADRLEVIWDGLMAGLIGSATVAILVGILNIVEGRSFFFTAAMLGEKLFYGLRDPSTVVVWPGAVFAYNGVHLLGFFAIGMSGAWLAYMAEKGSELWYLGLVLFLLVVLHAYAAVLLMTEGLRSVLPAWMILVPTLAGVSATSIYLLYARPGLRTEMKTWHG